MSSSPDTKIGDIRYGRQVAGMCGLWAMVSAKVCRYETRTTQHCLSCCIFASRVRIKIQDSLPSHTGTANVWRLCPGVEVLLFDPVVRRRTPSRR